MLDLFPSYQSRFDANVGRQFARRAHVGLFGSATQQILEYRFGDGRSGGVGIDAGVQLGDFRLTGNVAWYRHTFRERPGFDDYNQTRGRLAVTYSFSADSNDTYQGRGIR